MDYCQELFKLVNNYIKASIYPSKLRTYEFGRRKIDELTSARHINPDALIEAMEIFDQSIFSKNSFERASYICREMINYLEEKTSILDEGFSFYYVIIGDKIKTFLTEEQILNMDSFERELIPSIASLKKQLNKSLEKIINETF